MADLYDLSEEERREIGDYLDKSPGDREESMLRNNRGESRIGYDVLGAIVDMSGAPSEYLHVDKARAFQRVLARIDKEADERP